MHIPSILFVFSLLALSSSFVGAENDCQVTMKKQDNYACIIVSKETLDDGHWSWKHIIVNVLPPRNMSKIFEVECETILNRKSYFYCDVCYIYTHIWNYLPASKYCKQNPDLLSYDI